MAKLKKCPDCAEMVQGKARKCRYCGHEFPQETAKPKPSAEEQAKGCLVLIVIIVLIALVGQCAGDDADDKAAKPDTQSEAVKIPEQPYEVRLQREVDALKKHPRLVDIPHTKDELLMSAVLIGGRILIYNDAPAKLTPEEDKVRKEFRKLQVAYQRDAFPKLRKAQAKVLDNALWEQNVDVATIGPNSNTLRLTGGIFASNKGVKIAQENIADTLEILRFKQVRYEWYRGSEYQYYDLKPLADGTLATFSNGNRWVPIE